MRRVSITLVVLTVLALGLLPIVAQGGTIADVIQQRSTADEEFTVLQILLDTSPSVRRRLNQSGSFTFFAPTDQAFQDLETHFNITIDDLLADEDTVTTILNYHFVSSRLDAGRLRSKNGTSLETGLAGESVSVSVTDEQTITLNESTELIEVNIIASNGVMHAIDRILLPSDVEDTLAERTEQVAETTSDPTTEPTSVPTEVSVSNDEPANLTISTANVRVGHFVADAPDVSVMIEDELMMGDLSFGTLTDFAFIQQGIYTASILSFDDDDDLLIDLDIDLTLLNGDFITILLVGSFEDDTIEVITFIEDFDNFDDDEARVVLTHSVYSAPAISLILDDESVIDGVSFGERESIDLDPANVSLQIVQTRDGEQILFDAESQALTDGSYYSIFAFGSSDDPQLVITELSLTQMARLQGGQSIDGTPEPDVTSDVRSGSIVSVLDAEDGFTILIAAVQVANPEIINILGNADADNVTFLAPTNLAFDNLLATVGYSRERLLSDTDLLTDILNYHIVEETLLSDDFLNLSGTSVITRLEPTQAFLVRAGTDGSIFLNGAVEFERTDILASNGVIHVVDDVLLPLSALEAFGL